MPPFDRAVLKWAGIGCLTALIQYFVIPDHGHPRPPGQFVIIASISAIIGFFGDRYFQPWLERRRDAEDERRIESERWRMN